MINKGERIITGVSGGADSVCLLYLLHKLSQEIPFDIQVVHVNHMLRSDEADRDEAFVKQLCSQLDIPCVAVHVDVKTMAFRNDISEEEAGRLARYKAFDAVARRLHEHGVYRGAKVAVAHHRDDNVETVLLNLVRGSGFNGLKGMQPVSVRDQLTIIRPLLGFSREDIERYLKEINAPYVNDSSNYSTEYTRNKIRHYVIPQLKKINARAVEHIDDTTEIISEVENYMDKQITEAARIVVDVRDDSLAIDVEQLENQDPALRTGVVYRSICHMAGTMKNISRIHVRDVISLAGKQTGRRIELPYGVVASRSYSKIVLRKTLVQETDGRQDIESKPIHEAMDNFAEISIPELMKEGTKRFYLSDGGYITFRILQVNDENRARLITKKQYTKVFDCDKIKGTLILGRPQPGDEIRFFGGTKSLKKYFIDEKIPQEMRNDLMVLKDLDGVLWVLGYRIGEPYKITDRTQTALLVSVTGGSDE